MKFKRIILTLPTGKTITSGKMEKENIAKVIEFYSEYFPGFTFEVIDVINIKNT